MRHPAVVLSAVVLLLAAASCAEHPPDFLTSESAWACREFGSTLSALGPFIPHTKGQLPCEGTDL
jgi:hypothetical protein